MFKPQKRKHVKIILVIRLYVTLVVLLVENNNIQHVNVNFVVCVRNNRMLAYCVGRICKIAQTNQTSPLIAFFRTPIAGSVFDSLSRCTVISTVPGQ